MAVFTGLSEYFRGAGRFCGASKNVSKYFRALLNIFGALFNIYGEHFTFTGSVLYVIIIYGALLIIFGDIKFTLKLLRTILNFCGILPQTDRHSDALLDALDALSLNDPLYDFFVDTSRDSGA